MKDDISVGRPAQLCVPGSTVQLDLQAKTGDLIAVIQSKDPSGNRGRWFCDNGHKQVGGENDDVTILIISQHLAKNVIAR